MKRLITGLTLGLCMAPVAQADTLFGLYLNANAWMPTISGDFASENAADIDTDDQLGLDDESATVVSVAIEHFIPLMPNVRLRHTDVSWSESTTLSSPVQFDGNTFNGAINSTIDLSHLDGTMYYEVLDNLVSLDLGLTARVYDGEFTLQNATTASSLALDAGIPMLYVSSQVDLPFMGWYAGGELNHFSLDGQTLQDYGFRIGWESDMGLGVEGGMRTMRLSLDDLDDTYGDIDAAGLYVAGTFHF